MRSLSVVVLLLSVLICLPVPVPAHAALTAEAAALAESASARTISGRMGPPRASGDHIWRFDMQPAGEAMKQGHGAMVINHDFALSRSTAGAATKPGYIAVTPETQYNAKLGYGFMELTGARARDGGRLAPLCRDYITATQADFRVDVPNGMIGLRFVPLPVPPLPRLDTPGVQPQRHP